MIDATIGMIYKLAGVKAGAPVARGSWIRTLHDIRTLPEVTR